MSAFDPSKHTKWWDPHPHTSYQNLEKIKTRQPWYDVYRVKPWLHVIYEAGIFDEPVIYLIEGEREAAVIDGGSGIGRLDKLVAELTEKPFFLLLTHTHNDHIGGCKHFRDIAAFDDVMTWERAAKGYEKAKMMEIIEGENVQRKYPRSFDPQSYYAPPFTVTRWLRDCDIIDLGGRRIEVIHTPGHASNEICLLDQNARFLYTGDHFYNGGISTYLPGGDPDQFIASTRRLIGLMPSFDLLMPAHHQPLVKKSVLHDLLKASYDICTGEAKNGIRRQAVAVDYNIPIIRYQYPDFALMTDLSRVLAKDSK